MSESNGSEFQRTRNEDPEEISGGGALREKENFVEDMTGQGEEMGNRGELGLEPDMNPQGDYVVHNTLSQSPQNSPQSVVDSVCSSSNIPLELNRASDLLMAVSLGAEENKIRIIELVNSAMAELERKAFGGEPLWHLQGNSTMETLNEAEYIREFHAFDATLKELIRMIEIGDPSNSTNLDWNFDFINGNQHKIAFPQQPHQPDCLQTEASREIGFVSMNATTIVEWLMDLKQWSSAFSKIVSRASVLGALSLGTAGNYHETLQVMRAEFHMPTPLLPVRECQFARYCKQLGSSTWGIVDVSLENLFPYPIVRFRRRPSGCVIQELPNGYSKVTWVEHVEVDNTRGHRIFQPLIHSGFVFSARRWVSTLIQHCEWVTTLMSDHAVVIGGRLIPLNGKESLLRLANRMVRNFCVDLSASTNNLWTPFPVNGAEDYRLMSKNFPTTCGCPTTSIAFTNSLSLSVSPDRVFHILRQPEFRNKWDLLSRPFVVQERTHIIIGQDPANCISIIQANSNPGKIEILYLQESFKEPTASYVVYAPIDIESIASVLNGGNPESVNILPSGFVIHPGTNNGTILTLSFHIIDGSSSEDSIPPESIHVAYRILTRTAALITNLVLSQNP